MVGEVLEDAASVHAERFGNQFRVESDAEIDEPGRASVSCRVKQRRGCRADPRSGMMRSRSSDMGPAAVRRGPVSLGARLVSAGDTDGRASCAPSRALVERRPECAFEAVVSGAYLLPGINSLATSMIRSRPMVGTRPGNPFRHRIRSEDTSTTAFTTTVSDGPAAASGQQTRDIGLTSRRATPPESVRLQRFEGAVSSAWSVGALARRANARRQMDAVAAAFPDTASAPPRQPFDSRYVELPVLAGKCGVEWPERHGPATGPCRWICACPRYSATVPAMTGCATSAAWVISTRRGLASSATGMVRVSTPFS